MYVTIRQSISIKQAHANNTHKRFLVYGSYEKITQIAHSQTPRPRIKNHYKCLRCQKFNPEPLSISNFHTSAQVKPARLPGTQKRRQTGH